MERETTPKRARWGGAVVGPRLIAALASILLVAGATSCSGSSQQQTVDPAEQAERNHNEDVVDALANRLPEMLRQVAKHRASQLTIDGILAAPQAHLEEIELRRHDYLRALYAQNGHEPVWVDVDGTDAQLRPSARQLLEVLRQGAEAHGLWRDELHLDHLEMVDLGAGQRIDGRVFEGVQLDAVDRQAIVQWLGEQQKSYDPQEDLRELTAELISTGGPLDRLGQPMEEQVTRLRDVSETTSRIDVLFSDALVHYAMRLRFDNKAWQRGHAWPERLQKPSEEAQKKDEKEAESDKEPKLTGEALVEARRKYLVMQSLGPVFKDSSQVATTLAELPPPFEPYRRLTRAFKRYADIVEAGGWPLIPQEAEGLKRGASSEHIPTVKERLRIEGYYDGDDSKTFTNELRRALLTYQRTHQLWENGWLTPQTMRSLNDTATERWNQIRLTLERWRESRVGPDTHYVHVNIPDFHASVWRNGERDMYFKIVVGSTSKERTDDGELIYKHATPRFSDRLDYIVFNPYWNVPESIREKELEPKFEEKPEYFEEKHYEYFTDRNGHRFLRQKPGPHNALGKVKFLFPNRYNVYMHDTPDKHLFKHPFRAYSHGCVRIQDPMKFAHYLLDLDGRWKDEKRQEKLDEWYAKEGETWVNLRHELPVHIEYFVVRVDDNGHANFLADLYRLDRPRMKKIAAKVEALQSEEPEGAESVESAEASQH
ncbi:hypothetical protein FIV42_22105 [Persicimonas caeni]|uniref:L,D-TPase catalytic domain-containing protein n=1 Tax=Persicimonas caeni TaxID=2292766 RepID=A0A4Y6PYN4_PERCE|nr:L,D-transpeptidase family protein [Persicimonas caeni]QDG53340.1 hypothetical protein FIV42_22105 [Persicimonas caeni]QED34561.1 L,D-transpeptidase family protein [Persicimonas caeni]